MQVLSSHSDRICIGIAGDLSRKNDIYIDNMYGVYVFLLAQWESYVMNLYFIERQKQGTTFTVMSIGAVGLAVGLVWLIGAMVCLLAGCTVGPIVR